MFSCAVFDLDGTLANTLESIAYFGNSALKALGMNAIETEEYKMFVGNGADMLMRRMLKRSGKQYSEADVKKLRFEYDRRYEAEPMYLVVKYEGVEAALRALGEKGVKLGVISNKPDNVTKAIVDKLYSGVFSLVKGQVEGVPKKPDPRALIDMISELGALSEETIYIGDSGVDMQTGKNAKVKACGVLWGFRTAEELAQNGADYLVSEPMELEKIILDR